MSIRLNITMEDDLYRRLRLALAPNKGISSFISDAVRASIHRDRRTLDHAYRAASKENWRRKLEQDWHRTETESWPG